MTDEEKPQAAAPEVHVASTDEDMERVKSFFDENGKSLLFMAVLLVGGLAALGVYRNYNHTIAQRASVMLSKAENPDQLREIVDNYPKAPSAPYALSSIAGSSYREGKYDEALALYQRLAAEYGEPPYLQIAEMGRLHCLEAKGDLEDALAGFKAFAETQTGHYMQPVAVLGQARCLEQLDRYADARVVYENALTENPDSPWTPQVEQALRLVESK